MLLETGYSKVMALFVVFQVCSEMSLSGNYYLLPGDSHHKIRAIQAYNNHSFGLDKSLLFQHPVIIKLFHDLSVALAALVIQRNGRVLAFPSGAPMLPERGVVSYRPWCCWVPCTCGSFKKEKKTAVTFLSVVDVRFQL